MGKAPALPTLNNCAQHTTTATKSCSTTHPEYRYDLSHLTPIDRLPVELLIEIFGLCTGDDNPLIPLVLGGVCRTWREIVYATPDVWRRVSLDDQQRSITASHAQAALWLEFSRTQLIEIHIHLSQLDNLLPLLLPFFPHIRRCRSCQITGTIEEQIDFPRLADEPAQADLYHLGITIRGETELEDDEGATRSPTLSPYPPYLVSRNAALFNKLCMRVTMLELPLAPNMVPVHIRSLTILENSIEVTPDPVRFIEFLTFCPRLEELRFSGYPHEPFPPSDRTAMPTATLPYLHTLMLRSTCAVRAILSHIHAPALRSLYLEHTNMEFELMHAGAFSSEAEEGDSDDEAHDFSQSPWSDQGTGMGLRSLIKRSNPPLEVLDMNYADMRTKDFLWCFEKLDKLREFRIVASDMSDKVIALLAPYPKRGFFRHNMVMDDDYPQGRQEVEVGEEEDAYDASYYVRMPRLTTLELHNCHRLRGDAVINALSARVQYTDNHADEITIRKMRRVALVGCDGFKPRHVMTLLPILGTRLRTTAE